MTERIRPDRHRRRPAGPARRGRRRPAGAPPSTASRTARSRPGRSPRRGQPRARRSRRGRPGRLDRARASPSTAGSGPARRRRAPGPRYAGERIKLGPVARSPTRAAGARRPRGHQERRPRRHRHRRRCGSARSSVRQEADGRGRLGPRRAVPRPRVRGTDGWRRCGVTRGRRRASPTTSTRSAWRCPRSSSAPRWGDRADDGPVRQGPRLRALPQAAQDRDRPGDRGAVRRPAGDPHRRRRRKLALVEDEDGPFFTIDHFNGYNAVLVQLSRLGEIEPRRARRGDHRRLARDGAQDAGPKTFLDG